MVALSLLDFQVCSFWPGLLSDDKDVGATMDCCLDGSPALTHCCVHHSTVHGESNILEFLLYSLRSIEFKTNQQRSYELSEMKINDRLNSAEISHYDDQSWRQTLN
jgi:hypothetical protein